MKKLLYILLFFPLGLFGQTQIINVGTTVNDGTGDPLRTAMQKQNLNTVAIQDSFEVYRALYGNVFTKAQTSAVINDTVEARIAAASELGDLAFLIENANTSGNAVTLEYLQSYMGGGGTAGKFYVLSGNVDDTGFPAAGDTSLTHTNFIGKHVTVIREGQIQQQHANNTAQDGFWLNNATGELRFRPSLSASEQLEIWSTNTIQWEELTAEGGGGAASSLITGLRAGWQLDEVSGNTAYDVFETYNGLTNGTVNVAGQFGVAESFTTSQYTDFGQTVGDLGTDDFSVSLWFYAPSLPGDEQGLIGTCCDEPTFYITTTAANYIMGVFYFAGVDHTFTSDAVFAAITWIHVSVTVDRSGVATMYINGVAQADTEDISAHSAISMTSNKYFYIGRSGGDYFNGRIDDVYMHTKVLSGAEVTEIIGDTHPWN